MSGTPCRLRWRNRFGAVRPLSDAPAIHQARNDVTRELVFRNGLGPCVCLAPRRESKENLSAEAASCAILRQESAAHEACAKRSAKSRVLTARRTPPCLGLGRASSGHATWQTSGRISECAGQGVRLESRRPLLYCPVLQRLVDSDGLLGGGIAIGAGGRCLCSWCSPGI